MVDRYTKIVLTVIALALVVLTIQNDLAPLHAQAALQRVQICNEVGQCAAISSAPINGLPFFGLDVIPKDK
ncbi:MAG: hypothetical protein WBZ39_08325 [Methylovirgula sp.]